MLSTDEATNMGERIKHWREARVGIGSADDGVMTPVRLALLLASQKLT